MEQTNTENVKDLEDQLRSMILGNVRMDHRQQQHNQNQQGRGRGHPNSSYPTPHFGSDNRQHNGYQRGGRGHPRGQIAYNPRGRGQYGGPPARGGFSNGVPAERQEGFNHFKAQHGRGYGPPPGYDHPTSHQFPTAHNQGRPHHAQLPPPMDANSFQRGPQTRNYPQHPAQHQQHWNNAGPRNFGGQQYHHANENRAQYLDLIAAQEIPGIDMAVDERSEKNDFRIVLQRVFETVTAGMEDSDLSTLSLEGFGSYRSGFATKGSDMDLVIVSRKESQSQNHLSLAKDGLPRLLEKELLNQGFGARLLSRTRVPIIKICEKPGLELLEALREARAAWDALPEDQQLDNSNYSTTSTAQKQPRSDDTNQKKSDEKKAEPTEGDTAIETTAAEASASEESKAVENGDQINSNATTSVPAESNVAAKSEGANATNGTSADTATGAEREKKKDDRSKRPWLREKTRGPLDFPKDGVGIQCDINFFNPLGIHNTEMLRLYALCDPRVRPMVLFVKAWAKKRRINSPYSGTLSSYGYVLMVLHYLVNVARPPVLPNLQFEAQKADMPGVTVDEWEVRFWRDEEAITQAVQAGQLTRNREPLGALLRGFFQYFAVTSRGFGYVWMQDVLSLRSPGGIISKQDKGWTGAKTETTDTKEVRHRYLFAIEDPFEQSHNVGRTVTHNGIIAIRDEFRRVNRILMAVGNGQEPHDGHLFDSLVEQEGPVEPEQTSSKSAVAGAADSVPGQESVASKESIQDAKSTQTEG